MKEAIVIVEGNITWINENKTMKGLGPFEDLFVSNFTLVFEVSAGSCKNDYNKMRSSLIILMISSFSFEMEG